MVSTVTDQQAAPGALEEVRTLLNTWRVPNDTRVPVDELDETFDVDEALRVLRDDLRAVVEGASDADRTLTAWIDRLGVTVIVDGGRVRFRHDAGVPVTCWQSCSTPSPTERGHGSRPAPTADGPSTTTPATARSAGA
jgi:hypothetical protein